MLKIPEHETKGRRTPAQYGVIEKISTVSSVILSRRTLALTIAEMNDEYSQREVGRILWSDLRGRRDSDFLNQSQLSFLRKFLKGMSLSPEVLRVATNKVVHEMLPGKKIAKNLHRARSQAAQERVIVRMNPNCERAWSDEEMMELVRALRVSCAKNHNEGFVLSDILEDLDVECERDTAPYERVRSRIKKIRSSVKNLVVRSHKPSTKLDASTEVRLIHLLGYRYAQQSSHSVDWNFIREWMEKAEMRFNRERCVASIKNLQLVTTPLK